MRREQHMRKIVLFFVVSLGLILPTNRVRAHHSFTAEYDSAKVMSFTGSVTKVEWMNPHARFYLDVKSSQGITTNWNFELGSPVFLRKLGWKQDSLKVGDLVTVEGYLAKDGSKMANARKVTMADGRSVFVGSSADGNPTR